MSGDLGLLIPLPGCGNWKCIFKKIIIEGEYDKTLLIDIDIFEFTLNEIDITVFDIGI